jgi:hypothetical protein
MLTERDRERERETLTKADARANEFCQLLIAHLRDLGYVVQTKLMSIGAWVHKGAEWQAPDAVNGQHLYFKIKTTSSGSSWSRRSNDKLVITLGDYGDTRMFPEPKAGFDVSKTAERIIDVVAESARKQALNQAKRNAEEIGMSLQKEVQGICNSIIEVRNVGSETFKLTTMVSADQAREVAKLLKKLRGSTTFPLT